MTRNLLLALFVVVTIGGRVHAGDAQDFVTVDPEPERYAWWLRARYHPFETELRGIPVQKIRKNWCKASEFRRDLFPQELQDDLNNEHFAIDGFFDGSKVKQTALWGAYETCDGVTGGFFLILGWPRQGPPAIRFIVEDRTDHPFASLEALRDSSIRIWFCMSCDFSARYKWDRSKRNFVNVHEKEY